MYRNAVINACPALALFDTVSVSDEEREAAATFMAANQELFEASQAMALHNRQQADVRKPGSITKPAFVPGGVPNPGFQASPHKKGQPPNSHSSSNSSSNNVTTVPFTFIFAFFALVIFFGSP
jgi:hypothetical protein